MKKLINSNKIISLLKDNKLLVIIVFATLLCFIYCSKNTFIINDDLPYSFYYRTNIRISNREQIIANQHSDYNNISPRVFVHFVVQYLLIYGKKIWNILNPIMIILTMLFMFKISKLYIKKDNNLSMLMIVSLFLSMITYKKIIYWVAGSVNYVWTGLYLLVLIYIYLKYGFSKYKIINIIFILSISILHEYLLVFSIIFIFIIYISDAYKNKKILTSNLLYFIPLIISSIFLLKAPSMNIRTSVNYVWNNMNIIQKLLTSIPVVSRNFILNSNLNNFITIIFLIFLLVGILKRNLKYKNNIIISTLIITIISIIMDNGWLYFLLSILLFFLGIYYLFNTNKSKIIPIYISMYGIVYSMCITPEYDNYRANYIVYLFLIILSIIILYDNISRRIQKELTVVFLIICSIFLINEVYSYTVIGKIHKERIKNINECINNNCKILQLKKIPNRYEFYHMDINSPMDSNYFAFNSFINYYNLNNDIIINFYK